MVGEVGLAALAAVYLVAAEIRVVSQAHDLLLCGEWYVGYQMCRCDLRLGMKAPKG